MPESKVPQCTVGELPPDILLIEDNAMDIKWTLRALGDSVRVCHAKSGHQALQRLSEARERLSARPRLVLLDITIAAPDGFALLSMIRNDPTLSTLPVVILTQSNDPTDIRRAYQGLVNCYVWKPRDREPFARVVQQIRDFWLSTATLPR
jgi:two-component system, response regulator